MRRFDIHGEPEHLHTGTHGFGFNVQYRWDHQTGNMVGYTVKLGHQCDRWVVADEDTKGNAEAALRQFILEAGAALRDLEAYVPGEV